MSQVTESTFAGQPAVVLESAALRLVVLPGVGGRIVSLVARAADYEWLHREPGRTFQPLPYGCAWTRGDMSGWEDCLPTIAAGPYPDGPWAGTLLPEHGEVWTLPWAARLTGKGMILETHGVRLPYHLRKELVLADDWLVLRHWLHNPTAFPMVYLWATHPLFRARPGLRIGLPAGVRLRLDWSRDGRLGDYLDPVDWPEAVTRRGERVRLDVLGGPAAGVADKLYAVGLPAGWCGLHDPEREVGVVLLFDPQVLPAVGVWLNLGGWPVAGPPTYHLALEPTVGYPDLLAVAAARGTAPVLAPGATHEWSLELRAGRARTLTDLL